MNYISFRIQKMFRKTVNPQLAATIVLIISVAGCSKHEAVTEASASSSVSPSSGAQSVAQEVMQAINGEPPKCSDPAVVNTLKSQFLESTVLPTAEMELAAVGASDANWKGRFKEVFTQRVPLAAKNIAVNGVVSDGYVEERKLRNCAAEMAFGENAAANVHATYTLQLTEAGDDTLLKSNFIGRAGLESEGQRNWAVGYALRAMFAEELAPREAAVKAAAAEKEKEALADAARVKEVEAAVAKADAEKKRAVDDAVEEARAMFKGETQPNGKKSEQ
jgi:hypothetical protein